MSAKASRQQWVLRSPPASIPTCPSSRCFSLQVPYDGVLRRQPTSHPHLDGGGNAGGGWAAPVKIGPIAMLRRHIATNRARCLARSRHQQIRGIHDHAVDRVIEAHGGLKRWKQFKTVEADVLSSSELLERKTDQSAGGSVVRAPVNMHEQTGYITPAEADRRSSFRPGRNTIETLDGDLIVERLDPRSAFFGHDWIPHGTRWTAPTSPGTRCGAI